MSESTTEVLSRANELLTVHETLINQVLDAQKAHRRQLHALESPPTELLRLPLISPPNTEPPESESPPPSPIPTWKPPNRPDLPPGKRARVAKYRNYVPEEETIRNDYPQHYVDSGEWPQNFVIGAEPEHRFEEYPKQKRFLDMKKANVASHSLPPYYLPFSDLNTLQGSKFDVILLDPPFSSTFTWDHLQELPVPTLAADPSFVFLWVGSGAGEGLERGREILAKWGYRRCEDVIWVKTNKATNKGPGTDPPTTSLLTRTKQHCLMGIRGTVRRSTDNWFVHCNVDTDVIIWEGDPTDPMRKPPEMHTLIENFCLGIRRLDIFGRAPSSLRRGWVTVFAEEQHSRLAAISSPDGQIHVSSPDADGGMVGMEESATAIASRWEKESWDAVVKEMAAASGGKAVVPMTPEIEALRPKSPTRGNANLPANPNPGMQKQGGGQQQQPFQRQQQQLQQHQPQQFMPQPNPMMGMGVNALGMGMGMDVDMMGGGQWAANPMMMGMPMMMGGFGGGWQDQSGQFGGMMGGGDGRWDDGSGGMQMGDAMGMQGMGGMQGQWQGQGGF